MNQCANQYELGHKAKVTRAYLLARGVRIVEMGSCVQLIGHNGDRLITTDLASLTDRILSRFTLARETAAGETDAPGRE